MELDPTMARSSINSPMHACTLVHIETSIPVDNYKLITVSLVIKAGAVVNRRERGEVQDPARRYSAARTTKKLN